MGAPDESPAGSIVAQRSPRHPQALVVTIAGRLDRADPSRFAHYVAEELATSGASLVVCDLDGLVRPDASAVDAICRIRVATRRVGGRLCLRHASIQLVELLDLMGLCDVLADSAESGLQA